MKFFFEIGIKKFIKKIFPLKWLAFFDFHLNLPARDSLGGPFNGQMRRREIFFDIHKIIRFNAIVETGALRGSTTEFFLTQTVLPVYSVEINPFHYHYTCLRLKKFKNAHIYLEDTVLFLKRLQKDKTFFKKSVFFYLDAHGLDYLPLYDELDIIARHFSESIIMIDDFQVPDDLGYGFDDYGPGKKLCLEYLQLKNYPNLRAFFPAACASTETGARRGCVILSTGDLTSNKIKTIKSLRSL